MIQQVIKTIRTLLPTTSSVTRQEIEQSVDFALLMPIYQEFDRNYLIREVESLYNIRMDDFRIIEDEERRTPWIRNAKSNIIWSFWNRYRDYLQIEKNYSDTVLNQIDKLTDRTLDGLFNPTEKIIVSKKGLVVGQVQSGKTSNYVGLINKATDAGYKVIIIIAGTISSL